MNRNREHQKVLYSKLQKKKKSRGLWEVLEQSQKLMAVFDILSYVISAFHENKHQRSENYKKNNSVKNTFLIY